MSYYNHYEDAGSLFKTLVAKTAQFASFVEVRFSPSVLVAASSDRAYGRQATRYKTEGVGGVGLKELLVEPVQRIPRYALFWERQLPSSSSSSSFSRSDQSLSY